VFWEPSMLLKAKQQHINWMGALKIYRCLSNGKAKAKAISWHLGLGWQIQWFNTIHCSIHTFWLKSVERVNYGLDISSNSLNIYLAHQLQHFAFSLSNLKPNLNHVLLEYSYSLKIQEYIPGLLYLNFQQKLLKYK
jgi:hypothetical protein